MTFSENLAHYAPIMLILNPNFSTLVYSFSTLPLKSVKVLKNQYGWRLCTLHLTSTGSSSYIKWIKFTPAMHRIAPCADLSTLTLLGKISLSHSNAFISHSSTFISHSTWLISHSFILLSLELG